MQSTIWTHAAQRNTFPPKTCHDTARIDYNTCMHTSPFTAELAAQIEHQLTSIRVGCPALRRILRKIRPDNPDRAALLRLVAVVYDSDAFPLNVRDLIELDEATRDDAMLVLRMASMTRPEDVDLPEGGGDGFHHHLGGVLHTHGVLAPKKPGRALGRRGSLKPQESERSVG